MVARLGGDEFGVLLTLAEYDSRIVEGVAERIRETLEPPFALGDLWVDAGASIGIASASVHGRRRRDAHPARRRRDYVAKESGSGHELYDIKRDPERARAPRAHPRPAQGHRGQPARPALPAQDRGPDRRADRLRGPRPLAAPRPRLLPPGEFIDLAERTDAVRGLTLQVIEKALRQVASGRAAGIDVPVAVNLSARVLLDVALPADIERLLDEVGVPPELLEVEPHRELPDRRSGPDRRDPRATQRHRRRA